MPRFQSFRLIGACYDNQETWWNLVFPAWPDRVSILRGEKEGLNMAIRQVTTTKKRKLTACMRGKAFVKGFNDKRKGKPLDYEAFPYDTNAQWDYERGRLFACIFD